MYQEIISGKLTCDVCGKAITWEKHRPKTRVEAEARDAGWHISPKGHRCPTCDWPGTLTPEERREYMRAYQREYIKHLTPEQKARRKETAKRYREKQKAKEQTNQESVGGEQVRDRRESDRRYRERNRERIAEKKAAWERENRDKGRARRARYRAREKAAERAAMPPEERAAAELRDMLRQLKNAARAPQSAQNEKPARSGREERET